MELNFKCSHEKNTNLLWAYIVLVIGVQSLGLLEFLRNKGIKMLSLSLNLSNGGTVQSISLILYWLFYHLIFIFFYLMIDCRQGLFNAYGCLLYHANCLLFFKSISMQHLAGGNAMKYGGDQKWEEIDKD